MLSLVVHIVFHPKSIKSRKLAEMVHQSLNDDPAIPGLRIPTRFTIEDGTELPPLNHGNIEVAQRELVLVLADDYLKVGYRGTVPAGRKNWGEWVADLFEACEKSPHLRCIPFQMTKNAWPLDTRLSNVNFPRAFDVSEEKRDDWVLNRLMLELVRFLSGEEKAEEENPKAPLTVFVSHTKMDVEKEPHVFHELMNYLTQDKPVDAWCDSGDIGAGFRFTQEIVAGVQNSALISLLTDSYSSREWCREEVLLAKELQKPMIVVDALQSGEIRSFPYSGNVPTICWSGDPDAVLNLLFKESLRHLHTQLMLDQQKEVEDLILATSPELIMVAGKTSKKVLYPDPPLGEGELKRLVQAGIVAETPLQRFAKKQQLVGQRIAVSLSESGDTERYGKGLVHLDQVGIEISRYLLLAGASLCYGGHLGSEGYTRALFELVRKHPIPNVPPLERIQNYVGWPLPLSISDLAEFGDLAEFVQTPRPTDLSEKDDPLFVENVESFFRPDSGLKRFAWARGMTVMRETQAWEKNVNARIVLGGKIGPTLTAQPDGTREKKWYNSRIPGVLEEVLCSLQNNQPVYLVGGFGGCARLVADLLMGKTRIEMDWEYHKDAPFAPEMRTLFEERENVSWWDYSEINQFLKDGGIEALNNGLTEQENIQLFQELDTFEIIRLLLKGLKGS